MKTINKTIEGLQKPTWTIKPLAIDPTNRTVWVAEDELRKQGWTHKSEIEGKREEIGKAYLALRYGTYWDSPGWKREGDKMADRIIKILTGGE